MEVILFQPQIPQNTGNIVRTCSVTGCSLTLVTPLGFSVTDKALKRAGLDYWEGVGVSMIDDLAAYLKQTSKKFYFFSSHATKSYSSISFTLDDALIFGSETAGLPAYYHETYPDLFVTIPMKKDSRCLNLANTASIVIYEAWRQNHFAAR